MTCSSSRGGAPNSNSMPDTSLLALLYAANDDTSLNPSSIFPTLPFLRRQETLNPSSLFPTLPFLRRQETSLMASSYPSYSMEQVINEALEIVADIEGNNNFRNGDDLSTSSSLRAVRAGGHSSSRSNYRNPNSSSEGDYNSTNEESANGAPEAALQ